MSGFLITLAVAWGLACVLLAALLLRRATSTGAIEVIQTGPERLAIRTPRGGGSARIIVHDDFGKVYEVSTNLRGEGPAVSYVPPAPHLVRAHLARRIDSMPSKRKAIEQ